MNRKLFSSNGNLIVQDNSVNGLPPDLDNQPNIPVNNHNNLNGQKNNVALSQNESAQTVRISIDATFLYSRNQPNRDSLIQEVSSRTFRTFRM